MIELLQIAKTYPDGRQALAGVDLSIGQGMLGVLGPNGAGKTTLLSILVLALEPTSGSRRYDGLDPARPSHRRRIRRTIGYLPQDFQAIPHLSGREYLTYCSRLRELPMTRHQLDRRVRLLLGAVDLEDAADRRAGQYSGGMRRRLGIAQALVHSPDLLVVDEPTAGLDPEERIRFRNLIAEAAEETAVLLSTHICEDIETTCDRIAVIGKGRVMFDGPPSDLIGLSRGRLWIAPASAPERGVSLGRRIVAERDVQLVYAESPAGDAHEEITLEESYAALLARHGSSHEAAA